MHKQGLMVNEENWMAEVGGQLHDLCQPLTALHCRLEIGAMHVDAEGMKQTIEEALHECERLNVRVHSMQAVLRQVMREKRLGSA